MKFINNKIFHLVISLVIITGWLFTGWPPIWQHPRIPPQTKQAKALVPSGLIIAWPSTNGSIPVGWSRETNFDTYFVEGTTSNPSASAFGNATHSHASPNHQHTIDHTHSGSLGNASGAYTTPALSAGNTNNHVHTTNVTPNTDLNVAQSATATLGTASNDPPYTKVILIKSNGTTLIPTGAYVFLASDTFTGWTRRSGNRYLKGADASGDGGGTGGTSDAHTHTDSGHTHTENAHTHIVTTNAGNAGSGKAKTGTSMSDQAHSHGISGGDQTATEQSGVGVLANDDGQPPYYKLNIIENTTGSPALLDGTIAMWDGTIASIPTDWILCDGSGTCPNLNDKFIKGANADSESGNTGGALTHTHSAGTAHSHTIDSHSHSFTVAQATETQIKNGNGATSVSANTHTHTFSLSGGGTTATQTITADANSPNDNRPPYKEIVYIKYVAPVTPTFTAGPAESTASTTTNPTTEGAGITFQGTATAGTNWKLLICKTSGTSGTDCDGGASDRWCVSSSGVASASQNTCAYTTTSSEQDTEAWYGYACDTTSCASESQGSGDSGSPFVVNNPPPFTAFSDNSGKNPGETVTFSSTANDTANPGDT
ncbi:MAG: Pas28, partial [Candidatus Falkowbacteria bacterium GW2011_GWA2_39_24]